MKRSAAWSSSCVLTPWRTLPASRFMVLTRIAPAAAMRSTSSGLFLMITTAPVRNPSQCESRSDSHSHVVLQAQGRDHGADVVVDLGLIACPVDAAHQALGVVVVDQRLGLVVVDLQSPLDHVGLVVVALDQARAVLVANAVVLRRVELDVVVVAGLHADAAARQPPHDLLVGHVDEQRG